MAVYLNLDLHQEYLFEIARQFVVMECVCIGYLIYTILSL